MIAALSLVFLAYPRAAEGQWESDPLRTAPRERAAGPPTWVGELAFLSGNAALGGLTAALIRELRGGSFWEAFLDGALGGAVVYGAGLAGREVAAVGTSIVRNASDGRGTLEQLVLPIGVARLYLQGVNTSVAPVRARVSSTCLRYSPPSISRSGTTSISMSARPSRRVRPSSSLDSHGPSGAGWRRKSEE